MEDDVNILTFKDILAMKRTIDEKRKTVDKLNGKLKFMQGEKDEMKEFHLQKIEEITTNCEAKLLQREVELLSELEEKENEIRDWEANTVGLRDIINISKTAISNNVLLCLSVQLDTTPETPTCERVKEHFLDEEIDNAKNVLFDVCGGPKELRRGGSKESKKEKDYNHKSIENTSSRGNRASVCYIQGANHATRI